MGLDSDVMVGSKILVDRKEYDVLKKKAAQLDQINVVFGVEVLQAYYYNYLLNMRVRMMLLV